MSIRIKKSFLWIWIAALLSATVGISVEQIYCYCVGKTTISIFAEAEDACTLHDRPAVGSINNRCESRSCCNEVEAWSSKADTCTKKSVKVFQLQTEYVVGQPLDWSFDLPIWADEFPEYLKLFRPVVCDAGQANKSPPPLPPPLSGRMICVRHELFRC